MHNYSQPMQGFFSEIFCDSKTDIYNPCHHVGARGGCTGKRLRSPREKDPLLTCRSPFGPGVAQAVTGRAMWVGLQTPCDSKSKQAIRAAIRHQGSSRASCRSMSCSLARLLSIG